MKQIQEVSPQRPSSRYQISDFHQPVPADRYQQEVREGYANRLPHILQRAAKGGSAGINFMLFDQKHNEEQAMMSMYSEGITLYPHFPFLHLFLSLACPWRKLAVLVEEEDAEWTPEQIQDENELLTLHGWRVFRIPCQVARTFKEEILPDHISYGLENGWQDEGEKEEWEALEPQLATSTIDGFFKWLKKEHFSRAALIRYQLAAREQIASQLVETPAPTPEEEMQSILDDLMTEQEKVEDRFKKWATKEGYNTDAYPTGQYIHHRTDWAWKVWQAAVNVAPLPGHDPGAAAAGHAS